MQRDNSPHALIVGGGLAGLTAAAYLSKAGHRVTLFEKAPSLGGRASTQHHAGFAFNLGIHAIYSGGATTEVLQELGVTYTAGKPGDTYVLRNGRLSLFPASPMALVRSTLLSPLEKLELMGLFARLPGIDSRAFANVSVEDWLKSVARGPELRGLLASIARTFVYSSALDLVSAEVFIDKLQRTLKHPVHYLDGGWQVLVDGLRRVALEHGASIRTGLHVQAVEHSGAHVLGVRLANGNLIEGSAVILASSPSDAVKLVQSAQGGGAVLAKTVDALIPARLACLDLALSDLPDSRYPIVQDFDEPVFFSTQSRYARIAPQGGALVHAFKQLDPRRQGDPHDNQRDLEKLLDRTQSGWRERVVHRVFLPHIQAVGAMPTATGGGFSGRPAAQVSGMADVYLAGDWVGPIGFLSDASLSSARTAARVVLRNAASIAGASESYQIQSARVN